MLYQKKEVAMHGMDGFFGMGWMMILWWVLIVFGFVALAKWMFASKATISNNDTLLEIIKPRYAKGEITRDEYENLKKDLE